MYLIVGLSARVDEGFQSQTPNHYLICDDTSVITCRSRRMMSYSACELSFMMSVSVIRHLPVSSSCDSARQALCMTLCGRIYISCSEQDAAMSRLIFRSFASTPEENPYPQSYLFFLLEALVTSPLHSLLRFTRD